MAPLIPASPTWFYTTTKQGAPPPKAKEHTLTAFTQPPFMGKSPVPKTEALVSVQFPRWRWVFENPAAFSARPPGLQMPGVLLRGELVQLERVPRPRPQGSAPNCFFRGGRPKKRGVWRSANLWSRKVHLGGTWKSRLSSRILIRLAKCTMWFLGKQVVLTVAQCESWR